jgi:hypothetical protein
VLPSSNGLCSHSCGLQQGPLHELTIVQSSQLLGSALLPGGGSMTHINIPSLADGRSRDRIGKGRSGRCRETREHVLRKEL